MPSRCRFLFLLTLLVGHLYPEKLFCQTVSRPASPPTVSVGVAAFRGMSSGDSSLELGSGIADSLTNALKSASALSVLDLDVIEEAARQSPELDIASRDADAITLGEKLSLQMIVVGSYQQIGGQIRIDARILNIATKRPVPGQSMTVTSPYPDGYFALLTQLSDKVIKALQIRTTPAESRQIDTILKSTRIADARIAYNRGLSRMGTGTVAGLAKAIDLFGEAVSKDPDFGLAYAAKSEAETRLIQLNRSTNPQDSSLAQDALRDAETSVAKAPQLGRSYRALANAQTGLGRYDQASVAARKAVRLTPNDAGAFVALSRANGRGTLARDPDLDRAFELQPGISFVMRECPKVTVVNNTSGQLLVTVAPSSGTGKEYPPFKLQTATSRQMAILPGSFLVGAECEDAHLFEQRSFEAGQEYKLTYSGAACAARTRPAFVIRNSGNVQISVQISGVSNRLVSKQTVAANRQKRVVVPAGQYSVLVTARGLAPSTAVYSLGGSDEEQLDFSVVTRVVPR